MGYLVRCCRVLILPLAAAAASMSLASPPNPPVSAAGSWPAKATDPQAPRPAPPLEMADPRRPLDEGVGDRSGLSRSLRRVDPGLAASGFDRVFEAPDGSGRLLRRQGGLTAIFGSSVYGSGSDPAVEIPPGTIFRLGGDREVLTRQAAAAVSVPRAAPGGRRASAFAEGVVHPGVEARVPGSQAGFGGSVAAVPPTRESGAAAPTNSLASNAAPLPRFVSDEAYRRQRLRRMLERIAGSD